jgi:hypothetical protein
MPQTFTTKTWSVSGETNFGEFTLLNPEIKVIACQLVADSAYLQLEVTENGGVFKHITTVTYKEPSETEVDDIVSKAMSIAFPESKTSGKK